MTEFCLWLIRWIFSHVDHPKSRITHKKVGLNTCCLIPKTSRGLRPQIGELVIEAEGTTLDVVKSLKVSLKIRQIEEVTSKKQSASQPDSQKKKGEAQATLLFF